MLFKGSISTQEIPSATETLNSLAAELSKGAASTMKQRDGVLKKGVFRP